jgi:hypothetical protein
VLLPLAVKFIDTGLGVPLPGVKVLIDAEQRLITNPDGYVFTEGLPRGEHRIMGTLDGYIPYHGIINTDVRGSDSGQRVLMMEPLHEGILMGKVLVIDPEGGGESVGATGPSGTRASDLNLQAALKLAAYLESAGAEVYLTRTGDNSVPPDERVALANSVRADYFFVIRHDASERSVFRPYVAYYGTSAAGVALAKSVAMAWLSITGEEPWIIEEYSYILRHTPCPAIALVYHDIGTEQREETTYSHAYGMRESYAVCTGLIEHLVESSDRMLHSIRGQVQMRNIPDSVFLIEVDDWLIVACDPAGHFIIRNLTPGQHLLRLLTPMNVTNEWWVNTEDLGNSPLILTP